MCDKEPGPIRDAARVSMEVRVNAGDDPGLSDLGGINDRSFVLILRSSPVNPRPLQDDLSHIRRRVPEALSPPGATNHK